MSVSERVRVGVVKVAYGALSTAIDGVLSSAARRIFFAGWCAMSAASSSPIERTTESDRLGIASVTGPDDAGDERDDAEAEASGGVVAVLLFERALDIGSLT